MIATSANVNEEAAMILDACISKIEEWGTKTNWGRLGGGEKGAFPTKAMPSLRWCCRILGREPGVTGDLASSVPPQIPPPGEGSH